MGQHLVLLHPFPFDARIWAPLASLPGVTLHALDLPGFGARASEPPLDSIDAMADDVARATAHLDHYWLGGMSMGGYVALGVLRRHGPAKLDGLLLCDTRADADPAENKPNRDAAIALVRASGVSAYADLNLPKLVAAEASDAVKSAVRALMLEQPATTVVAGLAALRDRPDATAELRKFPKPVRCLVGARDVLTPLALHEKLAALVHDGAVDVIEGAGHLPVVERPEAFCEAVMRALSGTAGTPR